MLAARDSTAASLRERDNLITWGALTTSLAYAFVRYVLGAGVPADQLPLYIVNKAAALAGLITFGAACVSTARESRSRLGERSVFLVVTHVLFNLALLDPEYFAKLYRPDGRYTLLGGAALTCGVISFVCLLRVFCVYTLGAQRLASSPGSVRTGTIVLVLAAAHTALLGARGWLAPETWPLAIPPITLLGFLAALGFALAPSAYRAVVARRKQAPAPLVSKAAE
jgi:hypothetical protein